jgi:dienelactone hydrolase
MAVTAPLVVCARVDTGDVVGVLATSTAAPALGVLVLGGSEGGVPTAIATELAQHGFAALALAYVRPGERFESVPLERFDLALSYLGEHPSVDGSAGLAVLGVSKGGEAALLAAARNTAVRRVVCIAGSGIVFQAPTGGRLRASSWSSQGVDLPYARLPSMATSIALARGLHRRGVRLRPAYARALARHEPAARIPVERINGSVLLISGGLDGLWPASELARDVQQRVLVAGHADPPVHLDYPDAGHDLGPPLRRTGGPGDSRLTVGGDDAATAVARADAWERSVAFLAGSPSQP